MDECEESFAFLADQQEREGKWAKDLKLLAERDRYKSALIRLLTDSILNDHQAAIVREALGLDLGTNS